jgi:hypothetical protein
MAMTKMMLQRPDDDAPALVAVPDDITDPSEANGDADGDDDSDIEFDAPSDPKEVEAAADAGNSNVGVVPELPNSGAEAQVGPAEVRERPKN